MVHKKRSLEEQWDFIKENIDVIYKITKDFCKKNDDLLHVLLSIKRIFDVTPISLKVSSKTKHRYYRELTLFILVHYANASFDEIAKEFRVTVDELEKYKNKDYYEEKYKSELENYFEEKMISLFLEQDGVCLWIMSEDQIAEFLEKIIETYSLDTLKT